MDDKLGLELSVCLPCIRAARREIKKEELINHLKEISLKEKEVGSSFIIFIT